MARRTARASGRQAFGGERGGCQRASRDCCAEREFACGAHAFTQIPLAALPHDEAHELVTIAVHRCHSARGSYSLRKRHAMRDCSDHSSMKPGDAACENRPPDSENDARLASYTAFGEERVTTRTWPL